MFLADADGREDDQRDVDDDQQPRVAGADGGQDQQADQLHHRDAEIAAAGVDARAPNP